jgi:hypothetical protein
MRQHLIDFAAKRDWKSWAEFLPIFADWLEDRGDPSVAVEAMACRAAWKLSKEWEIMRYWLVPIPDWCSEWRQEASREKSVVRALDGCVNQDWFLHCAPGGMQFRLAIGLSRHKVRMPGAETAKLKLPKTYRFYEVLEGSRDKVRWTRQQPAGWRIVHYRVAPETWETRREFWTPVTPFDRKIVEHGFAALFWPPDRFLRVSTLVVDGQARLADNAEQGANAGSA